MTPLAKWIAERSVYDKKWWRGGTDKVLWPFPEGVKCFEVTQVYELASDLAKQAQSTSTLLDSLAFLPAPLTWLEHTDRQSDGSSLTSAYLLRQKDNQTASCVSVVGIGTAGGVGIVPIPLADLPLLATASAEDMAINTVIEHQNLDPTWLPKGSGTLDKSHFDQDASLASEITRSYWLYAVLSIINSPRTVHRSDHKPNSGLNKRLTRANRKPFALLPWHEIKLEMTTPEGSPELAGQRISGPKALHFCRQHIRIRLGRLELVRGHWRGDASLGLAQSRYRVVN